VSLREWQEIQEMLPCESTSGLTLVRIAAHIAMGDALTVVGLSFLIGPAAPWHFIGNVALGIWLVMEGTSKLYIIPYSATGIFGGRTRAIGCSGARNSIPVMKS